MKRMLLLSASALVLGVAVSACMTPQRRETAVREKCDVGESYAEIAEPANAEAYRDAMAPRFAQGTRRGWPFETHWFRDAAQQRTVLCNLAPAYNYDRHGDHCIDNQTGAVFRDTPAGPVKIDDVGVVCID